MGHESWIELWSPNLTTFCFVGFGTDRLHREEAMKIAARENPNRKITSPRNRAHGAVCQNRSRSIKWAEKQEKLQPQEVCFCLTSPFIELLGSLNDWGVACNLRCKGERDGPGLHGLHAKAYCAGRHHSGNPKLSWPRLFCFDFDLFALNWEPLSLLAWV